MISLLNNFAAGCAETSFFGFPTWYKYLPTQVDASTGVCEVSFKLMEGGKFYYADLLLVSLGVLDILLRVVALVAVVFVIVGGFKYMSSQGSPDGTKSAQGTIINALIGLVIAILAATIVGFIGNRIG